MRLARGIQLVRSPMTRCPTISKALQLSAPSFAATHRLGRPRRNVFNVDGVRDRRAMVSGRLNAVCMASYFGRAAHPHASTTQNRLDDALDLKYLTAEQRAELFKLSAAIL